MIKKYRKTFTPEAIQFSGIESISTINDRLKMQSWIIGDCFGSPLKIYQNAYLFNLGKPREDHYGQVYTRKINMGCWIVFEKNRIITLTDEVFRKTYEEVNE